MLKQESKVNQFEGENLQRQSWDAHFYAAQGSVSPSYNGGCMLPEMEARPSPLIVEHQGIPEHPFSLFSINGISFSQSALPPKPGNVSQALTVYRA